MILKPFYSILLLTILFISLRMMYRENTVLTNIIIFQQQQQQYRRIIAIQSPNAPHQQQQQQQQQPASQYGSRNIINISMNEFNNNDSIMNLQRNILNETLVTSSSSLYVPFGHTTIFIPQYAKYFDYYYRNINEMELRYQRFPSISERIQLYMSTWYIPPCSNNAGQNTTNDDDDDNYIRYTHYNDTSKSLHGIMTAIIQPIGITTVVATDHVSSTSNNNINNSNAIIQYSRISKTLSTSQIQPPILLSIDTTYSRNPLCFLYDRTVIQQCTDHLCYDAYQYFIPYVDYYYYYYNITNNGNNNKSIHDQYVIPPLILQHGDANHFRAKIVNAIRNNTSTSTIMTDAQQQQQQYMGNPNIPIFKKFRRSMTHSERKLAVQSNGVNNNNNNNEQCRDQRRVATTSTGKSTTTTNNPLQQYHDAFQPIISIVSNFGRHFYSLMHVIENDTTLWETKHSKAVYRGLCTGQSKSIYRRSSKKKNTNQDISDYDWCQQIPRCRLVYEYSNSTLVDAKLTKSSKQNDVAYYTIRNVSMIGNSMSMNELLQYKAIIMIEGNDVSSGLKWALFSKSVVLTQTPTYTSWAMEELLIPWVHYIPIANDLSDVEEKVQWMIDHDDMAKEIAYNGHLWMTDMIFHPQAMEDHEAIIKETFQRYQAHFKFDPNIWP